MRGILHLQDTSCVSQHIVRCCNSIQGVFHMEYTGTHVYEVSDVWEIVHFVLHTHTAWGMHYIRGTLAQHVSCVGVPATYCLHCGVASLLVLSTLPVQ